MMTSLVSPTEISMQLDNIKKLALANNEFTLKLHKLLNLEENCFTSPASIFIVLTMLHQGAEGVTADEIHSVLSFAVTGLKDDINQHFQELLSFLGNASDEYQLDIANAIMSQSQYPVSKEYKDVMKYYDATLKEVDFSRENAKALDEINNWISSKTKGKIAKLLESLDTDTVLVLLNAVYFKGTWKTQFSPRLTSAGTFYNDGIKEVTVEMMRAKNTFPYGHFDQYGLHALKLPYQGKAMSMVVLLPFERNGVSKLEQELTSSKLKDILSNLKEEIIIISIPKFKLEEKKELKDFLISLGMETAFTDRADFGGISREGKLKVSKIVHKAVIEVNEEGTEAAGATACLAVPLSACIMIKFLEISHPFIFFIVDDRTDMILFYGRVNKL